MLLHLCAPTPSSRNVGGASHVSRSPFAAPVLTARPSAPAPARIPANSDSSDNPDPARIKLVRGSLAYST